MIAEPDRDAVLELLGAAYPTYPVEQPTYDLYLAALGAAPFYDVGVLLAAVGDWVRTEDRYPTVHALSVAYQAEARRRVQARQQADQQRAEQTGVLPGMDLPLPTQAALEMVDVVRTALGEAAAAWRHSGHTKAGPGSCPTCAAADEIADRMEARVFALLEQRGVRPAQGPIGTYRCGLCLDTGFETMGHEPETLAPCRECNPEGHKRWADGHLAPGHWCSACDDLVRVKR